jgi:hypothetical protein
MPRKSGRCQWQAYPYKDKKMKTAELTGALLNYWVALAGEEWKHVDTSDTMTLDPSYKGVRLVAYSDGSQAAILQPNNPFRQDPREFSPSTDWAQGGPIIERNCVGLYGPAGARREWEAFLRPDSNKQELVEATGSTPLIAAMRAFVASRFGDKVPDEVLP